MTNALDDLKATRDRLWQRLQANDDFAAWHGLDQLIRQIEAARAAPSVSVLPKQVLPPAQTHVASQAHAGGGSQIDFAMRALAIKGHPLPTAALIPEMEKIGGRVGGKDPKTNLAGVLSKSGRVKAVAWKGSRGWWPIDQPIPEANREVSS